MEARALPAAVAGAPDRAPLARDASDWADEGEVGIAQAPAVGPNSLWRRERATSRNASLNDSWLLNHPRAGRPASPRSLALGRPCTDRVADALELLDVLPGQLLVLGGRGGPGRRLAAGGAEGDIIVDAGAERGLDFQGRGAPEGYHVAQPRDPADERAVVRLDHTDIASIQQRPCRSDPYRTVRALAVGAKRRVAFIS